MWAIKARDRRCNGHGDLHTCGRSSRLHTNRWPGSSGEKEWRLVANRQNLMSDYWRKKLHYSLWTFCLGIPLCTVAIIETHTISEHSLISSSRTCRRLVVLAKEGGVKLFWMCISTSKWADIDYIAICWQLLLCILVFLVLHRLDAQIISWESKTQGSPVVGSVFCFWIWRDFQQIYFDNGATIHMMPNYFRSTNYSVTPYNTLVL